MTHSIVVETANVNLTIKVFYEQQAWNFSRIPVYDKSKEYIIGYVLKDMVLKGVSEDKFETRLSDLMRPILSITDLGAELGTLLAQLGQRACPSWATCLPQLGRFAVRRLPNKLMLQHPYSCFQDSANTYNSCRLYSFHLIILFI